MTIKSMAVGIVRVLIAVPTDWSSPGPLRRELLGAGAQRAGLGIAGSPVDFLKNCLYRRSKKEILDFGGDGLLITGDHGPTKNNILHLASLSTHRPALKREQFFDFSTNFGDCSEPRVHISPPNSTRQIGADSFLICIKSSWVVQDFHVSSMAFPMEHWKTWCSQGARNTYGLVIHPANMLSGDSQTWSDVMEHHERSRGSAGRHPSCASKTCWQHLRADSSHGRWQHCQSSLPPSRGLRLPDQRLCQLVVRPKSNSSILAATPPGVWRRARARSHPPTSSRVNMAEETMSK